MEQVKDPTRIKTSITTHWDLELDVEGTVYTAFASLCTNFHVIPFVYYIV